MKGILAISILLCLVMPASALEIQAPAVPDSGRACMPRDTGSFPDALAELLRQAVALLRPELMEAARVSLSVLATAMLLSLVRPLAGKGRGDLAGAVAAGVLLLKNSNALIPLAAQTIQEVNDYGKLLFPVMTAAMAAQGGVNASAALYAGTAILDSLVGSLLTGVLLPGIYFFLAVAVTHAATGEAFLKRIRDLLKTGISWCLKTLLTAFTTYMSITGVVGGTTDAAALKATKVTISSVVPVVGGILSDASEAVLVGAGLMKNAAGIYGILAVLAVCLEPFAKIGAQYLMLKATAAICAVMGENSITTLTEDFSTAMGLLLGITGSVCLLLLISTVCFMKGVG